MNKTHSFFFCMSLIVPASVFAMDNQNQEKRRKKLGLEWDESHCIKESFFKACETDNSVTAFDLLFADKTLWNGKDASGQRALDLAITNEHFDLIKALLPLLSQEDQQEATSLLSQKSSQTKKHSRGSSLSKAKAWLRLYRHLIL